MALQADSLRAEVFLPTYLLTYFIVAHIEGCQSSEDLTLGGGEGGAVVVGTRQTAAAVMAAAMVAIEAGERAERTVCCCVVLLYKSSQVSCVLYRFPSFHLPPKSPETPRTSWCLRSRTAHLCVGTHPYSIFE